MAADQLFSSVVSSPGTTPGVSPSTPASPQWGLTKPTRKYAAALVPEPTGFLGVYNGTIFIPDPTENL